MNFSPLSQARGANVGNLYGWAIGFLARGAPGETAGLLLTSNDYYAKIDAVLPDGLAGGRVTIVLDAVTDAHYRAIGACRAAELYLFWQDVNADVLGYLGGISGLSGFGGGPSAADLAPALVTRFAYQTRRRSGQRAIETVLEGRDNAYHRLARSPAPRQCFDSMGSALNAIARAADVTIVPEPTAATLLGQTLMPEDEITDASSPGLTCAGVLATIASRIAAGSRASPEIPALRRNAPSVVLLRDGSVHVGRRAIPFPTGSTPKMLDPSNGLVEAARAGEAGAEGAAPGGGSAPEGWTLLCRGRSDLRPGDVVRFKIPHEDVATTLPSVEMALAGALAGPILGAAPEPPDCSLLVTEVTHAMSRTGGFSTRLSGRPIPDVLTPPPWSVFHTETGLEDQPDTPPGPRGGDRASAVARQVRDLARAAMGRIRLTEVAEVRSAVSRAGSPPEPPSQTVTVWEGTGAAGVHAHQSRRLPINRDLPYERRGCGTVTPFAWGQCGLAVPRYPGMRVMVGFVNGAAKDPIDLGATWGPDQRMESQPGDWWLKLPVDQSTEALSDTADHLPSGQVVNDLTDKDGTRVIEVGKLTIRVGEMPDIGARPEHRVPAAVSIEHTDGKARITLDQDGAITIAGATISIDAGRDGTVSITAKDVNVSVANRMSVGS